jgi:hypothetical protein
MSIPTSEHTSEHILSTERLEALADGIFAFAMTLLVLSIDLPASIPTASANQAILKYLIDLMPKLGIYVIAFLILGMLWYGHQRLFHFIGYIDTGSSLDQPHIPNVRCVSALHHKPGWRLRQFPDGHPANGDTIPDTELDLQLYVALCHIQTWDA